MIKQVYDYIKQHHMIEDGSLVMAGVSGGADSVSLLLLLKELQKEISFSLEVIHVEHGIRGEESRKDAAFVEQLCRIHKLAYHPYSIETLSYARANGLGTEEAARILRYQVFSEAVQEAAGNAAYGKTQVSIALAHHMEDQAETVIFQMIRGSGTAGICGMLPVRMEYGVRIIRPLLAVRRTDIENYLKEREQPCRTDATNQSLQYSRNRIRRLVVPVLNEINSQAVPHIVRLAEHMCGVQDYLRDQVESVQGSIWDKTERGVKIRIPPLLKCHDILAEEILYHAIVITAGKQKDITYSHVHACKKLVLTQSGRYLQLPYGIEARREYDDLLFYRKEDLPKQESVAVSEESLSQLKSSCQSSAEGISVCRRIPFWDGVLNIYVQRYHEDSEEIAKKTYTKCLDYDKVKDGFVIRTRQPGDYLIIDSSGHRKLLKKYLIEQKFPKLVRQQLPLIACGNEIAWVIGGRISETYKVSKETLYVIRLIYHGGNQDGPQNFGVSDRGTAE